MAIRILLSRKLGELRWTQADLARKTGIRPNTINDLYNEFATRVSLEHLDRICEVLNCDLSEILVREPTPIPEIEGLSRSVKSNKK
ncbi:MAG: helix-turn-helix domain-containing protein [Acutalibacteraceae bacterium]